MTLEWVLRVLLISGLVGVAGLIISEAAYRVGRPRRWVWLGAMLVTVALPWAGPFLARSGLGSAFSAASPEAGGTVEGLGPTGVGTLSVPGAALSSADGWLTTMRMVEAAFPWLWLVASFLLLGGLAWAVYRLRARRVRWTPAKVDGEAVLVAERTGPAVVGIVRPVVVVPRWVVDGDPETRRLIMRHETEHLTAGDTRLLALSALLVAAMPWNLPLWWQHLRLRTAIETDCDARVLAGGSDRRAYGRTLLDVAARGPTTPILALSVARRRSQLEQRLRALVRRPEERFGRARALLLAALGTALVVLACDAAGPLEGGGHETDVGHSLEVAEGALGTDNATQPGALEAAPGIPEVPEIPEGAKTFTLEADRFSFLGADSTTSDERAAASADDTPSPIYIVDGQRVSEAELREVGPSSISHIEVIKGAAAEQILGRDATGGIIRITTKPRASTSAVEHDPNDEG